jgi:hypothetical protein
LYTGAEVVPVFTSYVATAAVEEENAISPWVTAAPITVLVVPLLEAPVASL